MILCAATDGRAPILFVSFIFCPLTLPKITELYVSAVLWNLVQLLQNITWKTSRSSSVPSPCLSSV